MFFYNEPGHIKPDCAEWLKKENQFNTVNHLGKDIDLGDCFKPYLKKALINGVERHYLRDTGAGIDLCDRNWVKTEDFTGDITWVRQPLDNECECLPLAWATIKGDFGCITTKAAIKPSESEQGYYLLGNKTAELIEQNKGNEVPINMVVTRSRTDSLKKEWSNGMLIMKCRLPSMQS